MPYIGILRWSSRMNVHSKPSQIASLDPVWDAVRENARAIVAEDPSLSSLVLSNVLNHDTFEAALAHRLAERLDHSDVSADLIRQAFDDALKMRPEIGLEARA